MTSLLPAKSSASSESSVFLSCLAWPHLSRGLQQICLGCGRSGGLCSALAGINRQSYPKNYANLRSTYEQKAGAEAVPPPSAPAIGVDPIERPDPARELWRKFWGSRPVIALGGASCLWWAYDIFSHAGSCPSGGRLIGDLIRVTCENLGQAAAAGIPFLLGLFSLALALRPKRRKGA
jgi:hypothetical protein